MPPNRPSNRYAIAFTAALGLVMGVLDNTIINIALVPIARDLKVELSVIQWLVTGYFLSQAAVIPVAGYLGNRFGTRRLFMACITLFTIGSLLCGLAQDASLLIVFRVIQGIGAGALFPLAQTLALDPFPPEERASATSIVAVPVLLAPVFGPILGGWLNDSYGWQYLFLINVPIGVLTVVLTWRIIPADNRAKSQDGPGFDYIGLVLSTLGVLAVVYAFTLVNDIDPATRTGLNPRGESYGWDYWLVWTLAGASLVLLVVFTVYELRFSKDPVVDLRLFKNYNFTIASMVSWVIGATVFGALLLLPVFLQQVRLPHLSALDTGLALVPQGLGATLGVGVGGALYNRLGARVPTLVGGILVIIALWQFSMLNYNSDGWSLAPWNLLLGLGLGLTFLPSQTLALQSLSGAALSKANSLFNATRQIASSIATAVTVTLLVQQTIYHANQSSPALAVTQPGSQVDPNDPRVARLIEEAAARAGTAANNDVFKILAIATVLVILAALALPNRKRTAEAIAQAGGQEPMLHLG